MNRKIIKQGGQAYTITLPISWVRDNDLEENGEVDVRLEEKNLVISTNKVSKNRHVSFDTSGFKKRIKFIAIHALYARGIDEIDLKSTDGEFIPLDQTMGFAYIEQKGVYAKIKDISGTNENIDEVFKRVFQILISIYEQAFEDIFQDQKYSEKEIHSKDRDMNTFTLYLQRAIMKMQHTSVAQGKILFAYAFTLEQIGDEIIRAWRDQTKAIQKKEIMKIANLVKECLYKAFACYYHDTDKAIKELMNLKRKVRDLCKKEISKESAFFIMRLLKVAELSHDLSHLAIMRKF